MRGLSLAIALAGALWGCASPPDANACESVIPVGCADGGAVGYVDDSGAWVSGPWEGPHIPYPAFTTLRLCHGLGRVPSGPPVVLASFTPSGGILAQQIGNVASVIPICNGQPGVTRDSILVRNGAGQDFYARFILR